MDTVLYFPYVNLPDNKWSIRTILYWDKVASIVPPSYRQTEKFEKFTELLINNGLLEEISPYDIFSVPNYESSLSKAIIGDNSLIERARKNFLEGNFQKIHREKFHNSIFNTLVESGVAQEVSMSGWYIVEENVARLMMTFLGTILSLEKQLQLTTDNINNLDITFSNGKTDMYFSKAGYENSIDASIIRSDILENIMPYPMDLDLYKLRKFKEKNYEKLRSFRKQIEKTVFNISLINDESKRKEAIRREIADILDQKEFLIRKMKESNFQRIFLGGACGLVSTATPFFVEPSLSGVPALLYGLYAVYNETKRSKIENPIHYLALTEKRFLQSKTNHR